MGTSYRINHRTPIVHMGDNADYSAILGRELEKRFHGLTSGSVARQVATLETIWRMIEREQVAAS